MLLGRRLIFVLFISLLPLSAFANVLPIGKDCLLLGPKPSLIIKFKNISSKDSSIQEDNLIRKISSSKIKFTTLRKMSGGAFIAFFSPNKNVQSEQNKFGCFSHSVIISLIEDLKINIDVDYIVPNVLMKIANSSQPHFAPIISSKQWNLLTPPGGIDAQSAFNTTLGSPNVITAVIDSGILSNNSLTPNLLDGVTFNNNGYYSVGATPSCNSSCLGYDHGTHVSGTVAASGTLAYGESIYGVAPNTKILPVNVFTKITEPAMCNFNAPCLLSCFADQINALNWLNGEKFSGLPDAPYVTTVNMSFGRLFIPCYPPLQIAINNLLDKNISIAVAAGNDNIDASIVTPANCAGVMAVAATGPTGYGASYSNYGAIVSFAAPGGEDNTGNLADQIYSTIENGYRYFPGTSMASPHVAGLSALLYTLDPTLTSNRVLDLIQNTTTPFPIGGPGYSCTVSKPCGTGIINANTAVIATIAQAPILAWNANLSVQLNRSYSQMLCTRRNSLSGDSYIS